jgi:hypothetical protein
VFHAPLRGGLNIFMNRIVGYSDLGGLYAPGTGGLNIFVNRIVIYIDLGGFMPRG